ncbi:uncharacterized protein [Littorina saxatilis]|uniref:uncharacterized protein n=1 Tax=Littorina saxatilis TaxID=31220 RepID=UPI0038B43F2A
MSGTPPRLRLEIKVKNAREEDEGTWRLTVDNGFTDNAGVPVLSTVSFTLHVYSQSPPISPGMSAMIGVVGFLTLVNVVLVVSVVYFRKKSQRKGAINTTRNSDSQGDPDRVSGHSYEEVPDAAAPRPPRCHHHGQGQTSRPGRLPTAPTGPAVDSQPDDYLHPVNSQPASSRTNQPHDAPAATPRGPYDSLEMSDVGLRSPYSQLEM